ncbi:hypothetical protein [Streptomyces decoyicus]|uniref:hypothetical protein n=1 Tax=Streptomyces decoyicus TaxID=249567 RepID=UPI002F908824
MSETITSPVHCTESDCPWAVFGIPTAYTEARLRRLAEHMAEEHAPEPEATTTDPVRGMHEFALHTHLTLGMRVARDATPSVMWERASGTAAAWYVHRLLERLAEVDPDGVQAFAEELAEEGEMPELYDPVEAAQCLGFDAQGWIDTEYARRDAAAGT